MVIVLEIQSVIGFMRKSNGLVQGQEVEDGVKEEQDVE
jgi:hypothetical protein